MLTRIRRLRVSTRTLLLVVTSICVWLGWETHGARHEARVIAEMAALGGQLQNEPVPPAAKLRAWVFGRHSGRITGVHFLGPGVSDADLAAIARVASEFRDLARLTFVETAVSESGRRQLQLDLPEVEVRTMTPILTAPEMRLR